MSGVNIRVRADATQARNEISKIERAIVGIDQKATKVTKTFRNLAIGITAAFTGGALTKSITRSADSMTDFGNRVNLVTRDVKKTKIVMDELFKIAARSRGSIDGAAETFNRFGLALQDANKPVGELLKVTEAVQKAAVISGSGAESAKAAIVQLGQGLASGQLRGEELNSVLEQMPRLAKTIADGMGIPFGNLREEAMAGKITAEAVFSAILAGAEELDGEFSTLTATVGGLATVFGNEWVRAIGQLDKVIGVSDNIKEGIASATLLVQNFGLNIVGWSLLLKGEFLLAKIAIKSFVRNIKDTIVGLFSADLDTEALSKSILDGIEKAKSKVKTGIKTSISFTVEKVDILGDMFPNIDKALSTLRTFGGNVKDIFQDMIDRIFINSTFLGMFDHGHREPGQKLAIGSPLKAYLDKPIKELKTWAAKFTQIFDDLNFEVYDKLQLTVLSIREVGFATHLKDELHGVRKWNTGISDSFKDMSDSVSKKWTDLRADVNDKGLKPTFSSEISTAWDTTVSGLTNTWDTFSNAVFKTTKGNVSIPLTEDIKRQFKAATEASQTTYDAFLENIKKQPIVLGVITLGTSIKESGDQIVKDIQGYFDDNSDRIAVAISLAISAAISKRMRFLSIRAGIVGLFVSAANVLGHDQDFLTSVQDTARSWGKVFKDALSGDGDVLANVTKGMSNLAGAVVDGFLEGFFGEDFDNGLVKGIGKALTFAVIANIATRGLLFSSIRVLGTGIASGIAALGGPNFLKNKLNNKLKSTSTILKPLMAKMWTPVGIAIAAAIAGGFLGYGLANLMQAQVNRIADQNLENIVTGAEKSAEAESTDTKAIRNAATEVAFPIQNLNAPIEKLSDKELRASMDALRKAIELEEKDTSFAAKLWNQIDPNLRTITNVMERLKVEANTRGVGFRGYAEGGSVRGPGTSTSDDIPAMLSNGEFVMQASAVQKFGSGFMSAINNGRKPVFRSGGTPGSIGGAGNFSDMGLGIIGQTNRLFAALFEAQNAQRTKEAEELIAQITELRNLSETQVGLLEEGGAENLKKVKDDVNFSEETESYIANFNQAFKDGLSHALHTGDVKGALNGILDTFTSSVIDSFASSFTDSALEGLQGSLGKLFEGISAIGKGAGGAAGGFDIGNLIMKGISFFGGGAAMSQGGTVPSTPFSQVGKDSVPAMLMPGEVVLSKNTLRNMDTNSGQQQQVFNINVQGDVSQQTRKEIVKMMPQITGGVNAQNKENNYRR